MTLNFYNPHSLAKEALMAETKSREPGNAVSRRFTLFASLGIFMARAGSAVAEQGQAEPVFAEILRPMIEARLKALSTPGAIILVDVPGQGFWTEAFGVGDLRTRTPMSVRNHMRIGSITSTFTATAILQLVDRGLIGLDDPVARYRPDVPDGDQITIRQIMNMTSGLFNTTEDASLNAAIDANPTRTWRPQQVLEIAYAHPPYFAPGQGWHYTNTNYDILGQIVQRVSGIALPKYFREHIFSPLRLFDTTLPELADRWIPWPHANGYNYGTCTEANDAYLALLAGHPDEAVITVSPGVRPTNATGWSISYSWASGGIISTLHDLHNWAKALATGQLLSPAMHQERLTWSEYYHYGLGITESIHTMLGHSGAVPGYQSVIGYDVGTESTIVVLANLQLAPNRHFDQALPADTVGTMIYTTLIESD
jgi:D-alanyl-D-alanine carboxypeptidase